MWILLLLLPQIVIAADENSLNEKFVSISEDYYQEAAKELAGTIYVKKNTKRLRNDVEKHIKNGNHALATAMILANQTTIREKINKKNTAYFIAHLLDARLLDSAQKLAQIALQDGNRFTSSRVNFQLARFYSDQGQVDKAIMHLTAIKTQEALTPEQKDFATILFGINLQKKRRHRESIKIYEKITPDSSYYGYAQLNKAVAYIKQDWWTDAHLAIKHALEQPSDTIDIELHNRLLVTLGYSQLQHEFYRNARRTFRKINTDSLYVNRAILGIGLCALHQKDFPGALNAFSRLKSEQGNTLTILEANLLVPFSYEKMGELEQASLGYTEAIAYFENKHRFFEQQMLFADSTDRTAIYDIVQKAPYLVSEETHHKLALLARMSSSNSVGKTQNALQSLRQSIYIQAAHEVKQQAKEYIDNLVSYQSQAQYGLAKLYDSHQ